MPLFALLLSLFLACLPAAANDAKPVKTSQSLIGEKKTFEGKSYRQLHIGGQETIELLDNGPTIDKINRQLKAIDKHARVGKDDEVLVEPTYWSAHWLTVRNYIWVAGTGRNGIAWGHRTWNLDSGEQVDLWSWFGDKSIAAKDVYSQGWGLLPAQLKPLVLNNAELAPSCTQNADPKATQRYELTLEKTGMRFAINPQGDGCDIDVLLPFAVLLPVMTAEGKQALQGMIGSSK